MGGLVPAIRRNFQVVEDVLGAEAPDDPDAEGGVHCSIRNQTSGYP